MGKEVKTNAMRLLDRLNIPYSINLYDCKEFIDGSSIARQLGQPPERSFKTLVAQGKSGGYFVFALPVGRELDLKKAAASVGEKSVSLIPVKEINRVTGYIRGGCTPLGMKKAFPTVVDQSAADFDQIIISGGQIGAQILLAPGDLLKAANAVYADLALNE